MHRLSLVDKTCFPEDSEFYMTFLGPLTFIKLDGLAIIGCRKASCSSS